MNPAVLGAVVFQEVTCPVSQHVVGEYFSPTGTGIWRYICRRCQPKRFVLLVLRDGIPEIRTALYHGD